MKKYTANIKIYMSVKVILVVSFQTTLILCFKIVCLIFLSSWWTMSPVLSLTSSCVTWCIHFSCFHGDKPDKSFTSTDDLLGFPPRVCLSGLARSRFHPRSHQNNVVARGQSGFICSIEITITPRSFHRLPTWTCRDGGRWTTWGHVLNEGRGNLSDGPPPVGWFRDAATCSRAFWQ